MGVSTLLEAGCFACHFANYGRYVWIRGLKEESRVNVLLVIPKIDAFRLSASVETGSHSSGRT
jgi:hypothetical protein